MDHFFSANGIDDEGKKRSVFLSVIGPAPYKLLRSILTPVKPGEKEYKDLVEALQKQYSPRLSEIIQRFKFHTRVRRKKESVHNYVAELHSIAQFCNFESTLDAMLRDRLVCSINHEETQKKLLGESALTYQKALKIAQGLEVAAESLEAIKQGESSKPRPDQVNKLHVSGSPSKVSNLQEVGRIC